jgi:hypothetical protein
MAQVSRPFQIALAAVALLIGVWLFALRGHSTNTESNAGSSSGQPPASPAARAAAAEKAAAASSPIYHGAAPGVTGLSKDINKAHEAVATSQKNATQLQKSSQQASSASAAGTAAATPSASAAAPASAKATTTHSAAPAKSGAASTKASQAAETAASAARDKAIEARLHAGGVALLLFWDQHGSEDVAVANVLRGMPLRNASVYLSPPSLVASFGVLTRNIQVLQTPTLLVIGPNMQAHVITGLTDAYAIQQAISEAHGSRG